MLTYKIKDKDRFYFKNLDRVPEEELFFKAKAILDKCSDIKFTNYKEVVEFNIWDGRFKNTEFQLCLDIDYGPFLICEDKGMLDEIEEIIINE